MLDRLTIGERIASVSALVLLASTFFDWFKLGIPESLEVHFFSDGTGQSAWTALGFIAVVLAVAGAVAAVLILFRTIDPPGGGSFEGAFGQVAEAELTVAVGIFIGLAAAVGIAVGGALSAKGD